MSKLARFAVATCVLLWAAQASATLISRGPDLVYDDVLKITWTRNANLPGSANLTRAEAVAWAANLVYAGFDDWRLPLIGPHSLGPGDFGIGKACNGPLDPAPTPFLGGENECRSNELAYMFYYNLEGVYNTVFKMGTQTAVGGETILDIQFIYWSSRPGGTGAESFLSFGGYQDACLPTPPEVACRFSAWAVRDGDVPEPASLALLGLGLAGLGFSRGKSR